MTIDIADENLAGIYDLTLTIGLSDYSSVTTKTTNTFRVTLYGLTQTIMDDQVYMILDNTLTFQDRGVSLSPAPSSDPDWIYT